MTSRIRPLQAKVYAMLLVAAGAIMAVPGFYTSTLFLVPAAFLMMQAVLLWNGRALWFFNGLLTFNQLTALLALVLAATGMIASQQMPLLEICAALFLANMFAGGPLMAVLAIPLLISMHFGKELPAWFQSRKG